jgi:uncharacterized protein (TIGR01319 family)
MKVELALLVDFGSTYTKITLVDLQVERIIGTAKAFTTVETNILQGLQQACTDLQARLGIDPLTAGHKVACSSAAGGLKMVAVGLVRELTVEAAKLAVLGAGARVLEAFAHQLTTAEILRMESLKPDIILLAGGTDGGNRDVLVQNAKLLAQANLKVPIVAAGNKVAAEEVGEILRGAGLDCRIAENVMPELNKLNVEPARVTIREIFLEKIVSAKGLSQAEQLLDGVLMPTPAAVLNGAILLAQGTPRESGIGELVLVDVGGATTDVHSVAKGDPSKAGIMYKGLPEPLAKRTVEGDLGMRYSCKALCEAAGANRFRGLLGAQGYDRIEAFLDKVTANPEYLPMNEQEELLEEGMAKIAVELAMERHAGSLEVVYTPFGACYIQYGKDLTPVTNLIGTGGIIVNHQDPARILKAAWFNQANPISLRPEHPRMWVDREYILAAMGLLGEIFPDTALRLAKQSLVEL